jgi:predicted  nucleic acid-binding Zn-ribbon protein
MKKIITLSLIVILSNACVSKKKMDVLSKEKMSVDDQLKQLTAQLKQSQEQYQELMKKYQDEQNMLKTEKQLADSKMNEAQSRIKSLESQLELSKKTNTNLLSRLDWFIFRSLINYYSDLAAMISILLLKMCWAK